MNRASNRQTDYDSSLRAGERMLSRTDPMWRRLIRDHGPCGLAPNWRRSPYESLVRSITYQQLHGKAAAAILARFVALFPGDRFPSPEKVLSRPDEDFQGVGLSRQKLGYIRDVAEKAVQGLIPTHRRGLHDVDNDELIARFTQAKGVGRWSVEMMLIFSLGRLDVLPVDDYGVRAGYSKARKLTAMIKPKDLAMAGEGWAPYRSIAAWYLWRATEA